MGTDIVRFNDAQANNGSIGGGGNATTGGGEYRPYDFSWLAFKTWVVAGVILTAICVGTSEAWRRWERATRKNKSWKVWEWNKIEKRSNPMLGEADVRGPLKEPGARSGSQGANSTAGRSLKPPAPGSPLATTSASASGANCGYPPDLGISPTSAAFTASTSLSSPRSPDSLIDHSGQWSAAGDRTGLFASILEWFKPKGGEPPLPIHR